MFFHQPTWKICAFVNLDQIFPRVSRETKMNKNLWELPPPRYIGIVFLYMFMYFWSIQKGLKNFKAQLLPPTNLPWAQWHVRSWTHDSVPPSCNCSEWPPSSRASKSWGFAGHVAGPPWLCQKLIWHISQSIHSPKTWRMTSPTLFVEMFQTNNMYI